MPEGSSLDSFVKEVRFLIGITRENVSVGHQIEFFNKAIGDTPLIYGMYT